MALAAAGGRPAPPPSKDRPPSSQHRRRMDGLSHHLAFPTDDVERGLRKAVGRQRAIEVRAVIGITAAVESVSEKVLYLAVAAAQEGEPWQSRQKPDRVSARLLQLVLHRDSTLAALLAKYDQIHRTVRQFMDSRTASLLVEHGVVAADAVPTPDEPLPPDQLATDRDDPGPSAGQDEEALIAAHDKAQTEWQRRKDDAVTDAHLAQLLKRVHPVFALGSDAGLFLSAVVRDLLAITAQAISAVNGDVTWESVQALIPSLLPQALAAFAMRRAEAAVQRYTGTFVPPTMAKLRVRCYQDTRQAGQRVVTVGADDALGPALDVAAKKLRLDKKQTVFLMQGAAVERDETPKSLGLGPAVEVFAVPLTWWRRHRREEARRGLVLGGGARGAAKQVKDMKRRARSKLPVLAKPPPMQPAAAEEEEEGDGGASGGGGDSGGGGAGDNSGQAGSAPTPEAQRSRRLRRRTRAQDLGDRRRRQEETERRRQRAQERRFQVAHGREEAAVSPAPPAAQAASGKGADHAYARNRRRRRRREGPASDGRPLRVQLQVRSGPGGEEASPPRRSPLLPPSHRVNAHAGSMRLLPSPTSGARPNLRRLDRVQPRTRELRAPGWSEAGSASRRPGRSATPTLEEAARDAQDADAGVLGVARTGLAAAARAGGVVERLERDLRAACSRAAERRRNAASVDAATEPQFAAAESSTFLTGGPPSDGDGGSGRAEDVLGAVLDQLASPEALAAAATQGAARPTGDGDSAAQPRLGSVQALRASIEAFEEFANKTHGAMLAALRSLSQWEQSDSSLRRAAMQQASREHAALAQQGGATGAGNGGRRKGKRTGDVPPTGVFRDGPPTAPSHVPRGSGRRSTSSHSRPPGPGTGGEGTPSRPPSSPSPPPREPRPPRSGAQPKPSPQQVRRSRPRRGPGGPPRGPRVAAGGPSIAAT